jgi:hypothetical protein
MRIDLMITMYLITLLSLTGCIQMPEYEARAKGNVEHTTCVGACSSTKMSAEKLVATDAEPEKVDINIQVKHTVTVDEDPVEVDGCSKEEPELCL